MWNYKWTYDKKFNVVILDTDLTGLKEMVSSRWNRESLVLALNAVEKCAWYTNRDERTYARMMYQDDINLLDTPPN